MNGAITCLSNIIHENEDKTWTIVSANDETQMGLDHGWHYETITFLRGMETLEKNTKVIIPTKTVYFLKKFQAIMRFLMQKAVSRSPEREPAVPCRMWAALVCIREKEDGS